MSGFDGNDIDSSHTPKGENIYANRHIPSFLSLPEYATADRGRKETIQIVRDGSLLTAKRLSRNDDNDLTLSRPIVVQDGPKSIGMKVLSFKNRPVSVRDIADIIGHQYPVHVIDVEHQEELDGWLLTDLVEYFEDEQRLLYQHESEVTALLSSRKDTPSAETSITNAAGAASGTTADTTSSSLSPQRSSRRRRKAAEKCLSRSTIPRPRVLNQISLEFSQTPLRRKILSPQFVRDLDWIDNAWPGRKGGGSSSGSTSANDTGGEYPSVQYYILTSAGGCWTDFHLDFGGTAVWYHILSGHKQFCLIPPTKENLATYEDWLCRQNQDALFLPDMIANPEENVLRISLYEHQTLVIPTGWIHAVYTPSDSVVLGGNFLHGLDIDLQVQVHCIEARTRVQEKFRFPFFLALNFYAGGMYLDKLRSGKIVQREVDGLTSLIPALEEWWKVHRSEQSQVKKGPSVIGAARYAAQRNNCSTVEEFLIALKEEHTRVIRHGISRNNGYRRSSLTISLPTSISSKPTKPAALPTSPSTGKLKLRLKLSSAASPRSHNISTAAKPPTPRTSEDDGQFRIMVSSQAVKQSAPVPNLANNKKNSRKVREDIEWVVDEQAEREDDDWIPSGRAPKAKRRLSASEKNSKLGFGAQGSNDNRKRQKNHTTAQQPQHLQKTTASTTARQRLMKRFR